MPLIPDDGDAAGEVMFIDGEPLGMGMPLMSLVIGDGDGDAAAMPIPVMPWRRAART